MTRRIFVRYISVVGITVFLFCSCNRSHNVGIPTPNTPASTSPLAGKPVPDLESELLDGTKFSLKEQYGKAVVMLDFWATWCGPCVEELPTLMKLAEEYQSKGVVLYAVNQQEDVKSIQLFLEKMGWKLNVVLDSDSKHSNPFGVEAIPQLVLIDKGGNVRNVHIGTSPEMEELLRKELDAAVAASAK